MSRYSYTLLTAESEPDALDDRGMASEEAVLQAFDAFDWPTQVKTVFVSGFSSKQFSPL